jgi:hypothetical protein
MPVHVDSVSDVSAEPQATSLCGLKIRVSAALHTQAIAEASVEQEHDQFLSLALHAGVGHALGGRGTSEETHKDSQRDRSNVVSSGAELRSSETELRGRSNVGCSTHIACPDARKGEQGRKPPIRGRGGSGGGVLSVSANPKRRSLGE